MGYFDNFDNESLNKHKKNLKNGKNKVYGSDFFLVNEKNTELLQL
jgi:hypothetical protein